MVRTQIYLTEKERASLAKLSKEKGKKQSELIREAIDLYLEKMQQMQQHLVLQRVAGMWRDRSDLPDFERIRDEWDRAADR
jgi:metal-responsive CopG/Arc/MetJ family transcriptional regulator